MKATLRIENPDDTVYSLRVTMTLKEWKELEEQLKQQWPSARLSVMIRHLIREAEQHFSVTETDALQ